jgi:hypothetical protein
MSIASKMADTLVLSWTLHKRLKTLSVPKPSFFRHCRTANTADTSVTKDKEESILDDRDSDESQTALVTRMQACPSPRNTVSKPKQPRPEGKTINGYSFAQDNLIASNHPLLCSCYICTSPNHFACNCPHYGKWDSLCSTNLIDVELEQVDIENDSCMYLAMLIESQASSSAYYKDPITVKEVHVMNAKDTGAFTLHALKPHYNSNCNSRQVFSHLNKGKGRVDPTPKGQEFSTSHLERNNLFQHSIPTHKVRITESSQKETESLTSLSLQEGQRFRAVKVTSHPEGFGSLGMKALHIKVCIGLPNHLPIQGHLDSGTDITLMSEEYWKSIPGLLKPKEGLHIKLYHLTGKA